MAPPLVRSNVALTDIQLEEALAKKSLERGMFNRLLPLLRPVRGLVIAAVALEALLVGSIFLRPWFVKVTIDSGFVRTEEGLVLEPRVIAFVVAGLTLTWAARFGLAGVGQYIAGKAALNVLNDLRVRVYRHVQRLSVGYFDRTKAGRITARADSDVNTLEPLLIQGPPEFVSAILRCVVAGVLLWQILPALFFSVAAVVPVLAIATSIFKRISLRNWGRVAEERSRFTAHLVETVAGVRVIKQAVHEAINSQRYRALVRGFNDALISGNLRSSWFAPFTAVLNTMAIAALLLVGARAVVLEQVTLGQVAASLFYVFIFLAPLQELSDLFERYANGAACAQRIFLLLDTDAEIVDAERPIPLTRVSGDVDFERVRFSYVPKSQRWVIDGLDLHVRAGEVMAIVGPTGHGKSTLVQLLTRFYDVNHGAVRIDGVDVRDVSQTDLRRHVGVVLQDNVLFSGTILQNLRFAAPDATDAELIAASRELGADELLSNLAHGYDTEVGPLGTHLSHGQRQLVCLVRAYVANPAILVLDEATSAVDVQTERRLQLALRRLCQGRTAIIIAHRLSTIRDADRIAVIREGRVVELGSHAALMQAQGFYASLYTSYEQNALGIVPGEPTGAAPGYPEEVQTLADAPESGDHPSALPDAPMVEHHAAGSAIPLAGTT